MNGEVFCETFLTRARPCAPCPALREFYSRDLCVFFIFYFYFYFFSGERMLDGFRACFFVALTRGLSCETFWDRNSTSV